MAKDQIPPQTLTRKAAAGHLGFSPERLDKLSNAGEIPYIEDAGGERRYLAATLDRLRDRLDRIPDDHLDLSRFSSPHDPLLYFLRSGEFIRIGMTRNIQQSYRQTDAANPLPVSLFMVGAGNTALEKTIHEDFKQLHVKAEWFRNQDPLTSFIQQLYAGFLKSRGEA